ncbi:MAG TPA: response regulator transcription factor [Actinomycetota bacterium]
MEDNADDRRLLRELLEMEGVQVVGEAPNGKVGVELAVELDPDVILMDVRMPELSGIEATRLIKRSAPLTQVVMLTSADQVTGVEAREAGVYAYLQKGGAPQLIRDVVVQAHRLKLRLQERRGA